MVGTTNRVLRDYKPVLERQREAGRRVPWFVAGVVIPLICVGFMLPRSPASGPAPLADAEAATRPLAGAPADPAAIVQDGEIAAGHTATPATAEASTVAATTPPAVTELSLEIRPGDSLDRLFRRHHLSLADLAGLIREDPARKQLRLIRPGDQLKIRHQDGHVLGLSKEINFSQMLVVERKDGAYVSEVVERDLDVRKVQANGTIKSSLFLAAADAGVSDRTIMNLAGIFAWDIDFVLDIRQGDSFSVIYQEFWRDGKRVAEGEILAAEFINQGERYRAVRFETPDGRADYFTPDGRSVRKAFVRAPLAFSRISSNFNPRRRHPKLNTIRAHKGVDYAAPTGTPVKAAGDGKIIFRGRKGGYGNAVILQHGGNITTLYGHLSRFSKARQGSRVRQGDVIGYVGATGLATGPHLHYEYRRNGVHLNPRTVKLPDAEPLDASLRAAFDATAEPLLQQLDRQRTLFAAKSPSNKP